MDIKLLKHLILKNEGGDGSRGRNPNDSASQYPSPTVFEGKTGWHTVEGVTYKTWVGKFGKNQDQRWWNMSDEDWFSIFKDRFFDKIQGSKFKSMNIAAILSDIAFMSGAGVAIKNLQKAINSISSYKLVVDGEIGPKTIEAANSLDVLKLANAIVKYRKEFLTDIATGKNSVFLKGWINRTNKYLTEYMQ